MDQKIIEKPLFFLGFCSILTKSFKAIGNAFEDPLGTPWGAFGDALGGLGDALGNQRGTLEGPRGRPKGPQGKSNQEKPKRTSETARRSQGVGPAPEAPNANSFLDIYTSALLLLSSNIAWHIELHK